MMIDRTFVTEEQNILNRLREQEAKVNGNCAFFSLLSNRYDCAKVKIDKCFIKFYLEKFYIFNVLCIVN